MKDPQERITIELNAANHPRRTEGRTTVIKMHGLGDVYFPEQGTVMEEVDGVLIIHVARFWAEATGLGDFIQEDLSGAPDEEAK